jgi:hypothetical protein
MGTSYVTGPERSQGRVAQLRPVFDNVERRSEEANALRGSCQVCECPAAAVFDDLSVADAVVRDAVGLDLVLVAGDAEQFARVHPAADDAADDEVILGDLEWDLVLPRCRKPEDFRRLLQPVAVEATPGMGGLCRTKSSATNSSTMITVRLPR